MEIILQNFHRKRPLFVFIYAIIKIRFNQESESFSGGNHELAENGKQSQKRSHLCFD